MNSFYRLTAITFTAIALSACSSLGPPPVTTEGAAYGTPNDNIFDKDITRPRPGTVEVVVIRQDAKILTRPWIVMLNDQKVATMAPREKVTLWLDARKLSILGFSLDEQAYTKYKDESSMLALKLELEPNPTRRYTVRFDSLGPVPLTMSSSPVASTQ